MKPTKDELIKMTLSSFDAERAGDIDRNLEIIDKDFVMTDIVVGPNDTPFIVHAGKDMESLMQLAFQTKGRQYFFNTVIADENTQTVIVEFIESYPNPSNRQVYVTPQVAICVYKEGKLYRTRHYMDPRLSNMRLDIEEVKRIIN